MNDKTKIHPINMDKWSYDVEKETWIWSKKKIVSTDKHHGK